MRFFLDTNIILILFQGRNSEIKDQVRSLLSCEQNSFYTSSISLLEILQLYRKKKIDGIDRFRVVICDSILPISDSYKNVRQDYLDGHTL